MSANTSSAVMAQRAASRSSLDDFPTPPWATRALMEHVIFFSPANPASGMTCWEPACNRGFMARPLAEYFGTVIATDVHNYGWAGQHGVEDFLFPVAARACDFVITNPPFVRAEAFIARALAVARVGCAMLARTTFLEGVGRHEKLWSKTPPTVVAQFAERVPMVKGRYDPKASSATAYCWLVWLKDCFPQRLMWIPPCRRELERAGDGEWGNVTGRFGAAA